MEANEGASSSVYLALFCVVILLDRRNRRQEGAGMGLPGVSANASPVSLPSCLEFPFCRIIPAATRNSYNKLGVSALSALPLFLW